MLKLSEEKYLDYLVLYDQFMSELIGDGIYIPLMQHPILYDWILSQVKSKQKVGQTYFSIRSENGETIALYHGAVFTSDKYKSKEFSAYIMPGTFVESQQKSSRESRSQYQGILEKNILNNDRVWYRDYCNFGKISLLGSLLNIKGAKVTTSYTRIINIDVEERVIWGNFRKSYRNLVNQAAKKITLITLNHSNIKETDVEKLFAFHHSVVGKKTRSLDSWLQQYKLVLSEKAVFLEAYAGEQLVGFGFFLCFGGVLFYGSSAFLNVSGGASHAIIWEAIKYAKTKECKFFDIGEQVYRSCYSELDLKKLKSISLFKRGFGGSDQLYLDFEYRNDN